MKNITVSIDDETYRRARVRAAEKDTSVSAVVRDFLVDFATERSEFEQLAAREREIRKKIGDFDASRRLSRDALHQRES